MKIIIQTITEKQLFEIDDNPNFLESCKRCIKKGSSIKITVDNNIYLLNPRNIIWIEISNHQGD